MVDSDSEDELLVTFAAGDFGCSSCSRLYVGCCSNNTTTKTKTQSVGEQVFAKSGTVRDIQ